MTGKTASDLARAAAIGGGNGGSATPLTDLTISLRDSHGTLTKVYDALTSCKKGGWAGGSATGKGPGSCRSTVGPYLLGLVPLHAGSSAGKGAGPVHAVITLLEQDRGGKLVAVDSAEVALPADTTNNNNNPPTTTAPDLHRCTLGAGGTCA